MWHYILMKVIDINNRSGREEIRPMKIYDEFEMRDGDFEAIARRKYDETVTKCPDLTSSQVEDKITNNLERDMQPTKPVSTRPDASRRSRIED